MSTESHRRIDEEAGDWLAKGDSGNWTEADRLRFEEWLNASPLNRVAYLRIEHVWERSNRLKVLGAGVRPGEIPPPGQWVLSPFFEKARQSSTPYTGSVIYKARLRSLAASIVLAVALVTGWYLWPAGSFYQTPVGGIASLPMPDGSRITLNTDSEIRVAITEKERRVDLEQGEAFFEVAKDPYRPFVVHAGDKRIIAVGTKFSVRRDAEEVRVVVTEGKVRVETEGRMPSPVTNDVLTAGSIARASDAGVLVQQKALLDVEEELSWRSGVLVFREMTLADAVAEFNRYNARKIVIQDPGVAGLRVAGSFRATNVDAFVRLLERGYPLRAEQSDDHIALRGDLIEPK